MSTATKKKTVKGIRYTSDQKKEVVDFVINYNAANGRGGQSKAAEKFKISQLTVASWLSAAGTSAKTTPKKAGKGAKAPKAAKAAKAAKAPKAERVTATKIGGNKPGTRYSAEQKQEVVDYAVAYNAANGRGGQSKAAAHYNISPLTVFAWLKAAGISKPSKKGGRKLVTRSSKVAVSGDFDSKLSSLVALRKQIAQTEAELAKLVSQFNNLKSSL